MLPIGQLAKLTGVGVKSLRYYDALGILRPAYVDEETGYRYYTFVQAQLVSAIQLCVEVDIPLKRFGEFVAPGSEQIYYAKLVEQGAQLASAKMRAIQERLDMLEGIRDEIERAERCLASKEPILCRLPQKYCYTEPYTGTLAGPGYYPALNHLLRRAVGMGMPLGYEAGLLWVGDACRMFVDVEVERGLDPAWPELTHLPASDYWCALSDKTGLEGAKARFSALFAQPGRRVVLETELFTGDYDFTAPLCEVRCLAPQV